MHGFFRKIMNIRRTIWLIILLLVPLLPGAARAQAGGEITVSAAISLKNAFEELGRLFESRQKVKVIFNFGGSGALQNQIAAGAPVDVFASADREEMDVLERQGLLEPATRARFAVNQLVLIAPNAKGAQRLASFDDLRSASVERIAVGNPRSVPAGRYAQEVFAHMGLLPAVNDKLIFAENVRQALDYVARGEADAGVVYATDVRAREKEIRIVAQAPAASHTLIEYPIAVVRGTRQAAASKAFIALVLSAEGQQILRRYGFSISH